MLAEAYPDRGGMKELQMIGPTMFGSGVVTGLMLWGLGLWFTFLAVMSVGSHYIGAPPFSTPAFDDPNVVSLPLPLFLATGKTVAFSFGWWAFTCESHSVLSHGRMTHFGSIDSPARIDDSLDVFPRKYF